MRMAIIVLAVCAAVSSCHSSRQAEGDFESKTPVRVENRNFLDMKVYVVLRNAEKVRIGTVSGNSTQTLYIPGGLIIGAGTVKFYADPIGGSQAPISQDITVQPGEVIELIITN